MTDEVLNQEQKAVIDAKLTKRLLRLKTWMAAVDFHNLRQDKQRADGTCEWFEHDPKVCDWRSQTQTTFLWVYGKPGRRAFLSLNAKY